MLVTDNMFHCSKLKTFADGKIDVTETVNFVSGNVENNLEKGRKSWLPTKCLTVPN